MTDWNLPPVFTPRPDFNRLLAVLERRVPDRPVLFEFFLNDRLYRRLVPELSAETSEYHHKLRLLRAFHRAGYDYANVLPPGFNFWGSQGDRPRPKTASISQNDNSILHNQADFDRFVWPDPDQVDLDLVRRLAQELPPGMKLIVYGPGGVLENAIELVGYEDLCVMIKQDEPLALRIFGEVGARLERYYQLVARLECVGACISNDDWGFKTHTLFSPADMRHFVFGWHKRIVKAIHAAGKPAILHSCGYFERVMDDMVDEMRYDARHSYEDGILPVETAYERYGRKIAILGGLDLDFVCRSAPQAVYQRAQAMLARTAQRGGYALGTGNSVPEYVPDENYFAMIRAAIDAWE
jgi:uroporphyrinogen decarboxylase